MELLSSNIKKIILFSQRKLFLYFLKRKLFLYFQKRNPTLFNPSSKNKKYFTKRKFLILEGTETPKNTFFVSYILSPKLRQFLGFQERTWKTCNFVIFSQKKTFIFNFLH